MKELEHHSLDNMCIHVIEVLEVQCRVFKEQLNKFILANNKITKHFPLIYLMSFC